MQRVPERQSFHTPACGCEFRDQAPMTPSEASTEILDGVRQDRWRILVGDDARKLDAAVRANPEIAYESLTLGDLTSSAEGTPFNPAP